MVNSVVRLSNIVRGDLFESLKKEDGNGYIFGLE